MIQLPRRSVTRFFIPLVDVMILLFCIFLLMPMVRSPDDALAAEKVPALEERVRLLERELELLRKLGKEGALEPGEYQRLQQEAAKALQQRLAVRVLEIDKTSGKLFYSDPGRIEVRNQGDARDLVARDRRSLANGTKDLYYLILYPRDTNSIYPLREQREQYEQWFADTAHGWDIPGRGPAKGGQP
jgi:hypothetical protein